MSMLLIQLCGLAASTAFQLPANSHAAPSRGEISPNVSSPLPYQAWARTRLDNSGLFTWEPSKWITDDPCFREPTDQDPRTLRPLSKGGVRQLEHPSTFEGQPQ